ncbi:MAG: glucosaminidase domain-containing protein [Bacteroidota bacterium]
MSITKLLTSVSIIFMTYLSVNAQSSDNINYIKRYQKVAMDEMRIFGIPASITLAQGILESANGKSRLAIKANNHFGIKCANWTGKKIYHNDDKRGECFRSYPSPWGSYRDHSKFLKNQRRYADLFKIKVTDYKGWAYGLKKAGYATDKHYPKRLIRIIEDNKLYRFDQMVLNGTEPPQKDLIASTQKEVIDITEPHDFTGTHNIKTHKSSLDYIVIREGDSYESLSIELDIKQKKLLEYNDKNWDSPLLNGETFFIERKNRKGKNKYYKVVKGDSMYSIAQKEGIRLEYLYKRNRMSWGLQPKIGTILYLRKYKK